MEVPCLFLIKMGLLAGLSLLTYRRARRLLRLQQHHRRHLAACLTEVPAPGSKATEEDDASTLVSSRSTPSQQDYCSVYQPFLADVQPQDDLLDTPA